MTWLGFTVPTRSRAMARTSFSALKRLGFFFAIFFQSLASPCRFQSRAAPYRPGAFT
jgi:hypothetical protein